MKKIILLFVMALSVSLGAQNSSPDGFVSLEKNKLQSLLGQFSITATAGTNHFAINDLKNFNLKSISLSQLSIAYKLNRRISFGIASMDNLSPAGAGYYDGENQFIPFCSGSEDHDNDDNLDTDTGTDNDIDNDGDDLPDNDDDGCHDDGAEFIGQNLMAIVTYTLSDKLPFFVQVAGGYSLAGKAPVYSSMLGYNQHIFAGLGLQGGIRFSETLYRLPAGAISMANTSGIRAELGLSWNF